jgi:hypothetical protein
MSRRFLNSGTLIVITPQSGSGTMALATGINVPTRIQNMPFSLQIVIRFFALQNYNAVFRSPFLFNLPPPPPEVDNVVIALVVICSTFC